MNRRGFLGSIIAACAAPAIVRADALMRVVPPMVTVADSRLYSGGWHFVKVERPRRDLWIIQATGIV